VRLSDASSTEDDAPMIKRGQARSPLNSGMVVGGSQEVMEEKDEGEPFL